MQNERVFGATTFLDLSVERFRNLCEAVRFPAPVCERGVAAIAEVLAPWGGVSIGTCPRNDSDITDDHGPIEFSLALSGGDTEIRILFEALGADASLRSQWLQAQLVNELIERRLCADLSRLRRIEGLFRPSVASARFGMWHSLCLAGDGTPRFKVYLNPQAHGRENASALIGEALAALGVPRNGAELVQCKRPQDELKFFSLDLDRSDTARVKVYKVHYGATCAEIERELARSEAESPQALREFWRMLAATEEPLRGIPVSTYLSLTSGARPSTATLHFPIRDYVENDQVVYGRICALLDASDRLRYERAIASFAKRPLAEGVGMHSYVSIRQHAGPRRITVYLAPELYEVVPARKAVA